MRGRVGLCQGCFDVLHAGHIRHLMAAKQMCDHLVVALTIDKHVNKGPGRPINKLSDRMEVVGALACVDQVVPSVGESAVEAIKMIRPRWYIKGSEYRDKPDPSGRIDQERAAVEARDGHLVFTDVKTDSSTRIINEMKSEDLTWSIQGLNVLVCGDSILDGWGGERAKPDHLVIDMEEAKWHQGGATVFARHATGLGCRVQLYTNDSPTRKLRMSDGTRVDILDNRAIERTMKQGHITADPDVAIVADFGHANNLPLMFEEIGKAKVLAWNAQKNTANKRNLRKYWEGIVEMSHLPLINLVTMNQQEWENAGKIKPKCNMLVITRPNGADVIDGPSFTYKMPQDIVVDTTGCGDAFMTAMACSLGAGAELEAALRLGCLAGAVTTTWNLNSGVICSENLSRMMKILELA